MLAYIIIQTIPDSNTKTHYDRHFVTYNAPPFNFEQKITGKNLIMVI